MSSQCPVGQVCAAGACGPCQVDGQCDLGLQCVNGTCSRGDGGGDGVTTPQCNAGYVGVIGPVGSVWGNPTNGAPPGFGAAAAGQVGKAAGDAACAAAFPGSHVCTWEETKASDACGKLTALKGTTDTAWVHRTAAEVKGATVVVDDNPSLQPGVPLKGARCNDWLYPTNHAFDGEFVQFGGNAMVAHLDSDTADDNGATSTHAAAGVLECNGMSRKVLCCN